MKNLLESSLHPTEAITMLEGIVQGQENNKPTNLCARVFFCMCFFLKQILNSDSINLVEKGN